MLGCRHMDVTLILLFYVLVRQYTYTQTCRCTHIHPTYMRENG